MNDHRPVNLDLFTINQPIPAIASIIHRVSGLLLFFGVAILMYMLDLSLSSEQGFQELQECFSGFFAKLILWGLLSSLIYHLVAGIKHLLMDFGIGETLEGAQLGAKLTLGISIFLIIVTGVAIW